MDSNVVGNIGEGSVCWLRHDDPPYVKVVVDGQPVDGKVDVMLQAAGKKGVRVEVAALWPANSGEPTPDNSRLFHLSEATLLANTLERYGCDKPYTFTGSILTSVNPCKRLDDLYSSEVMNWYATGTPGRSREPHLYAVAETAFKAVVKHGVNQVRAAL